MRISPVVWWCVMCVAIGSWYAKSNAHETPDPTPKPPTVIQGHSDVLRLSPRPTTRGIPELVYEVTLGTEGSRGDEMGWEISEPVTFDSESNTYRFTSRSGDEIQLSINTPFVVRKFTRYRDM